MSGPMLGVTLALVSAVFVTAMTSSVPDKRIINGEEAVPLSHPYIVSIQIFTNQTNSTDDDDDANWRHFCGGVLINRNWVLTAAHCVDYFDCFDCKKSYPMSSLRVKLGEHHLSEPTKWEYSLGVETVRKHPRYCSCAIANDIALVKLATPARLGCNVQPASLSEDDSPYVYSGCVLAGWGRVKGGYPSSDNMKVAVVLQEVNITYIPNDLCASMMKRWTRNQSNIDIYGELEHLTVRDSNICALDISPDPVLGEGSACHGDSGGPMMCGEDHSTLVGITSWGAPSCDGPNVYTRVSKYSHWISSVTRRSYYPRGPGPAK